MSCDEPILIDNKELELRLWDFAVQGTYYKKGISE